MISLLCCKEFTRRMSTEMCLVAVCEVSHDPLRKTKKSSESDTPPIDRLFVIISPRRARQCHDSDRQRVCSPCLSWVECKKVVALNSRLIIGPRRPVTVDNFSFPYNYDQLIYTQPTQRLRTTMFATGSNRLLRPLTSCKSWRNLATTSSQIGRAHV